jgi:HAD superfamily hydrolase (TIGR01509 family)
MIVTFDFGQTLAELDHEFLAKRVAERGALLDPVRSRRAIPLAAKAYDAMKARGHAEAWASMVQTLLEHGGVTTPVELAAWLWKEQPAKNLWRKPIAGMFELGLELHGKGVKMGILSNSEGRLAELVEELGKTALFPVIIDSGRVGIDKPDRRIFELAAERLGAKTSELVHVGDSWEADVLGAVGAGARAIWFGHADGRILPERVMAGSNAAEVRAALASLGLL